MNNNGFSFRELLISSTYKTPLINFIFSTEDFVVPKFINYEEYRTNLQSYNSKYICEPILTHEVQTVKLMDINLKSKYLLLDVAKSFNEVFYKIDSRKNNLLIIVDETKDFFEIIFINTAEIYEEYSYVMKRFDKNDKFYENNMKNLSFLFVYYSLITTGISVISKRKISFLDSHNVNYLNIFEQQKILKKVKPFEKQYVSIFRFINIFLLFFIPIIGINYSYFTYKNSLEKSYKTKNQNLNSNIQKLDIENKKLKNDYDAILNNINDKREFYIKGKSDDN